MASIEDAAEGNSIAEIGDRTPQNLPTPPSSSAPAMHIEELAAAATQAQLLLNDWFAQDVDNFLQRAGETYNRLSHAISKAEDK